MNSVSSRANRLVSNPSPIVIGHMKCAEDPFSKDNQNGYLNFGIAQNHLMEEEIKSFILSNQYFKSKDIHYNPGHGKLELRETFSNFAENFLNIKSIDPNLVTIQTGVSSLCESLAFCLFDEKDTLLMPAPYYSGFMYDFSQRFNVNIELVHLNERENFRHNFKDFSAAIEKYNPKAILITHPYNPTGEILSDVFIQALIELCKKKGIHIISDEIYALSRLDGSPHRSLIEYEYKNIHLLYGIAKDFTLAGLKTGFFYTRDKKLAQAMQAVSYFHTTSTQTQNTVELLLGNDVFVSDYVKTNQKRIKDTYNKIITALPNLIHTEPNAGIFFFANFSHLLKEQSIQAEEELFNYFLNDLKINMTPGYAMGMKKYGYFRVCFAKNNQQTEEFINRLKKVLN